MAGSLSKEFTMSVSCGACGAPRDEDLDGPDGASAPCLQCGSTARAFDVHQTEGILASDCRKRHTKWCRSGRSRPYKEEIDGDDLQCSTGRWMLLTRTIDRANDWYSEKVVDPRTGEVVHQCEEPLSAHRGHGAAKR
jgi:hypothetical protein